MHRPHSYRHVHVCRFSRQQGSLLIKTVFVAMAVAGITAVVIPKYASAEKAGNELTIKSFLRTVAMVNKSYRSRHRKYADSLESLATETKIEAVVKSTEKTGYDYSYVGGKHSWSCAADPDLPGPAHFFVDQSGVIRFRADRAASSSDPEVE